MYLEFHELANHNPTSISRIIMAVKFRLWLGFVEKTIVVAVEGLVVTKTEDAQQI